MGIDVYPLIFEPIFKPKMWGGRKLSTRLGKKLPPDVAIGESWELADLEHDRSVVAVGPARGAALSDLISMWGSDLMGGVPLIDGRFPLLIKFLDAAMPLSVQVHPTDEVAERLGGCVRVKHEAWYVVEAEAEAHLYRGLRDGVDQDRLRRAIETGDVESVLQRIPARQGHGYYLPSGTVHALGGGVTVAEIQTPSDVTYRLYDWDRVEPSTGQPRSLHIEEAFACVHYGPSEFPEERLEHVASVWTAVTSLVRCPRFVVERVRMVEGVDQELPYQEPVVWIVLEGRGTIGYAGSREGISFRTGDTVLIPAGLQQGRVRTEEGCMWLEVTVPVASSLAGFDRPDRAALQSPPDKFVSLNVPHKPDA